MQLNTNRWNSIRYALYSPLYDLVIGTLVRPLRRRSLGLLKLSPEHKILLLGAGTGLDLLYLQGQRDITAIDITPAMLRKLSRRAKCLNLPVEMHRMDGQRLQFPDAAFDVVVLHFIIAVIPDPVACIKEAERVLKPGGQLLMLDKFLPDGKQPSLFRRIFNPLASFIATDINRQSGEILAQTQLRKTDELPLALSGLFKAVKAVKPQ